MKEIKLNLIIDGNYLLNKITFALSKGRMMPILLETLLNTLKEYKKLYPFNSIVLVSDSGQSWRKKLYTEYKASRKKDSDIDWDYVYGEYTKFKEEIINLNIKVYEGPSIEGDDWITFLVNRYNNINESTLILSSDKDISQLLTFNTTNLFVNLMYNDSYTSPRLYLPKSIDVFLKSVEENLPISLFSDNDNEEFMRFINNMRKNYENVYVEPLDVLLIKMISGDTSDNIKSALQRLNKSGKVMGVGETGARKILDKYVEEFGSIDIEDSDIYENIADMICEVKKVDFHTLGDEIKNNLKMNRKLIALDLRMIPTEILNNMIKIYNA